MTSPDFSKSVFINCPLDDEYEPLLQAILFCVIRFGFKPRIATEWIDSGETRLEKIKDLICRSKYSIHDLSRCQSSGSGEHYRMNMPFELGLDFGCKNFGGSPYDQKRILVLEEQQYRYQVALSDLAGSDIEAHEGDYAIAIRKVRNWITTLGGFEQIGASSVSAEYEDFRGWHFDKLRDAGFSWEDIADYPTGELIDAMSEWVSLAFLRN